MSKTADSQDTRGGVTFPTMKCARTLAVAVALSVVGGVAPASAAGLPMTWKQAEAKTLGHYSTAVVVSWVCTGHHANDHYWRVGFCTGKHAYKSHRIVTDVRQGEQARIRLAQGKSFTIYANDMVCPRGCPRPRV